MADQTEEIHPRIYQLDELLSDAYNAIYVRSNKYTTKYTDIGNLKMIRFKLSDYNLDEIFSKTKIAFGGKYPTGMKINGKEIEQIWIKRKGEIHMSTIRIVPYLSSDTINDMTDPINVNLIIRTLLSELVVGEKTNNILLPIINVDVKGSDLLAYEKIKSLIDKDKYYSIQVTEKYYSLITLDKFLKEYPLDLYVIKSIIYQAVNVLYQISVSYPNFRCNHFFPKTINCYLKSRDGIIYPELKLGDFYLAEIGELVHNKYLKSEEINIPMIESSYGDLYQLLNYLWKNHNIDIKKYPEIVAFFDIVLPQKIRSDDSYLTSDLWNRLTDDEKFELRIKNIKNNNFLSKDILKDSTFIEQIDSNVEDDTIGGKNKTCVGNKLSNELSAETYKKITTTKDEISEFEDTSIPVVKKVNMDLNFGEDSNSTLDKNDKPNTKHEKDINEANKDYKDKKYYDNDIGNMNQKKARKNDNNTSKNRKNKYDNITDSLAENTEKKENEIETTEKTEEKIISRPSRIINITESNISTNRNPKKKIKAYRGTRRIINSLNSLPPDLANVVRNMNWENQVPHDNQQFVQPNGIPSHINSIGNMLGTTSYNNQQFVQPNGIPSRINSIGNMLGATTHDFNRQPLANYGQISQQLAQQYDSNHLFPTNIPPNIPSQVPSPIQNPIDQTNSQQMDIDALYRYMTAYNQMPTQSQTQIDPNIMASYLASQNAQPINQQTSQPIQSVPQVGGTRHNPFFFQ
jgi:hypothetical protein